MRIHDLSVGISPSLPVWPGNPGIEIVRVQDMDKGDHANVSRLSLGAHTPTMPRSRMGRAPDPAPDSHVIRNVNHYSNLSLNGGASIEFENGQAPNEPN